MMIKEMSPSSDKVIIVTNPLMKDMSGKSEAHRANAIRVLCRITDANLLQQIERYMKQAVVDKSPMVASAALVSGIHLFKQSPDAVRRWSSEVQEVVHSRNPNVQFHALALLHLIRQNDRLAVNKLVTQLTQNGVRSPLAQCLLVRYVSHVMGDGSAGEGKERPFYSFLETCLRNKSEMVILESARAIVNMKNVTSQELQPAVSVLQLFLSSSKPALRFAAVRTLNKVRSFISFFRKRRIAEEANLLGGWIA